jgi:RNase adaptor protein for sRNA GlmZ degradation
VGKKNEILEYYRSQPCEVCGKPPPSDPAHITTKRLKGHDLENLMSLCRAHHSEQHQSGIKSFVLKYRLPIDLDCIYPKRKNPKE